MSAAYGWLRTGERSWVYIPLPETAPLPACVCVHAEQAEGSECVRADRDHVRYEHADAPIRAAATSASGRIPR
jgi:hypothetical protein